ncbi:CAAX amino terminal protease self- immunity [Tautonia plasticadhaerens]|uniref:CAAX amino terminal protease self-immunity n=2 Tax=Tautonia plasticadhaerens TaxID=2527974 RepID=A0A518GZR2_9BACT|nr:CAAX amino terminal protease self- immunity [Tautonia plasticadhaerens]
MRPPSRTPPLPVPGARPPSRRGPGPPGYWGGCRGASLALLVTLPMLACYEAGIAALGGDPALRTGVDAWIGAAIPDAYPVPDWAPSVALAVGLVAWRVADPRRFRARWLPAALAECLLLGAGLLGLYLAFDRHFPALAGRPLLGVAGSPLPIGAAEALSLVGAGIFEEAAFRLGLLWLTYAGLRILHTPNALATAFAASGSALAFSMAHHVGEPPGSFSWAVFVFRWLAGVYFSWVFILRGFGIAVGTHVAYDLLVASYPWPE